MFYVGLHQEINGIILAGGESRRFGSPKAVARYKNDYFINYSIKALKGNVNQITVVSHPNLLSHLTTLLNEKIIKDLPAFQGFGPLAGILSGMESTPATWYVVLPCDTPKLSMEMIDKLLTFCEDNYDAIVPVIQERKQPLIAVYHDRVKKVINDLLEDRDLKMNSLLNSCRVKYVTEEDLKSSGREFENINQPEDLI
jgi:molybdenum cofactor guanylyltransferase